MLKSTYYGRFSPRPGADRSTQAFYLLLISLGVFFVAGLVAYICLYLTLGRYSLIPVSLWISLGLLVAVSTLLHVALHQIRREQRRRAGGLVLVSFFLAMVFFAIQGQSLCELLAGHMQGGVQRLDGFVFCLVLLHGLHVAGGILALGVVTRRALAGYYDHESHFGLGMCTVYWHFLDGVWLSMLLVFAWAQ